MTSEERLEQVRTKWRYKLFPAQAVVKVNVESEIKNTKEISKIKRASDQFVRCWNKSVPKMYFRRSFFDLRFR